MPKVKGADTLKSDWVTHNNTRHILTDTLLNLPLSDVLNINAPCR